MQLTSSTWQLFRVIAFIAVFSLAAAIQAKTEEDRNLQSVLQSHLSAFDLGGSKSHLIHRLLELSENSGAFEPPDVDYIPLVTQVVHGAGEWVLILKDTGEADKFGYSDFWVGLRNGKAVVRQVPPHEDDPSIGPMFGEWRRHGKYLLGAGVNVAYHSPNFADGEIQVLEQNGTTLRLVQREHIEQAKDFVYFRSSHSNDLVSLDASEGEDFKTLRRFHMMAPTYETDWKFRGSCYEPVNSFTVHDELWVTDQLATAIVKHHSKAVARFLRNTSLRSRLVPEFRKILAFGGVRADIESYNFGLTRNRRLSRVSISGFGDVGSATLVLILRKVHGGWVVTGFKKAQS